MRVNIGSDSFGSVASFFSLDLTLKEKFEIINGMGFDGVELLSADFDFNSVEEIKK